MAVLSMFQVVFAPCPALLSKPFGRYAQKELSPLSHLLMKRIGMAILASIVMPAMQRARFLFLMNMLATRRAILVRYFGVPKSQSTTFNRVSSFYGLMLGSSIRVSEVVWGS